MRQQQTSLSALLLVVAFLLSGCFSDSQQEDAPPRPLTFDMYDIVGQYQPDSGPGRLNVQANGYDSGAFTLRGSVVYPNMFGLSSYNRVSNVLSLFGGSGLLMIDTLRWEWNGHRDRWDAVISVTSGSFWRRVD